MVYPRTRGLLTACGVAAILLATPAEILACGFLDCLFGWCGGTAATTYRPAYVAASPVYAPACPPTFTSCVPQTCRYVPQTCYRTVCQRVPVTTCQAVTCCDACTGCPVTTYRPVTAWTTQTRLVPYTTYRLVYSNPCTVCVSSPVCDPCGVYGPSVSYSLPGVSVIAAPSPCCQPAATAASIIPSLPSSAPASSVPPVNGTSPPTTFESEKPVTEGNKAEPIRDEKSDSTSMEPKLISPGRWTSQPVRETTYYHLISTPSQPIPIHKGGINDGGWRASQD